MDIHFIRENKNFVKQNQKNRYGDDKIIEDILYWDENCRINSHDLNSFRENKKYDHNDLGKLLGLIDIENGIKVGGNRGYYLTGMGVKLNLALINYGIDFLLKKNYTLMSTPHLVTNDLMSKITQLNDYEETL